MAPFSRGHRGEVVLLVVQTGEGAAREEGTQAEEVGASVLHRKCSDEPLALQLRLCTRAGPKEYPQKGYP